MRYVDFSIGEKRKHHSTFCCFGQRGSARRFFYRRYLCLFFIASSSTSCIQFEYDINRYVKTDGRINICDLYKCKHGSRLEWTFTWRELKHIFFHHIPKELFTIPASPPSSPLSGLICSYSRAIASYALSYEGRANSVFPGCSSHGSLNEEDLGG